MTWKPRVPLAILLTLVSVILSAENKQKEADSLISRASQLSNIRADGATPFKLTAKFSTIDDKGSSTDGTYQEIWASSIQRRLEIKLADFHFTEVVDGKKRWTLSSTSLGNGVVKRVGALADVVAVDPAFAKPDKITNRAVEGSEAVCLVTKPNTVGGRSARCFDQKDGLLLEQIYPYILDNKILDEICRYSDYQRFAEKMFPRSAQCFKEGKQTWTVTLELSPLVPDARSFLPPLGAKESVNCMGSPVLPPKPLYTPDPAYPQGQSEPRYPVVLWMIVGEDGKPQDIKVARTVNNVFDNAAIGAASRWKFQPATCDGQPVETQINVEFSFHVR